ncbi:hypothetical protein ACLB2K_005691 [Fragaria x ananassa]
MANRYIRSYRIPPHEHVQAISAHFGADASVWMNALEHFGSGNTSDFKAQLSHLQQQGTVDEFFTEFTKLSCRAPDWSDADLWPMFCGGLKNELRHDVLAMGPRSLSLTHTSAHGVMRLSLGRSV